MATTVPAVGVGAPPPPPPPPSSSSSSSTSTSSSSSTAITIPLAAPAHDAGSGSSKLAKQKQRRHQMGGGLMFALGISWCVSTEYLVLRSPEVLPYVYVAQIIPLLMYRFVSYYRMGWSHFTLELCYLSNALLILNILAFPQSELLFLLNWGVVFGPVLIANVVYRCSMHLGDLQRFISWLMHVGPPVVCFSLRWLPKHARFHTCQPGDAPCPYDSAPYLLMALALATTIAHALLYNLYVWVICPAHVRQRPGYSNSYIWIVAQASGSKPLMAMLNCFGPRGRVLSFTLMAQTFNAAVIGLAYAAWVSRTFGLVYLLVVIFATAYYAGTYLVFVADKAAAAAAKAAPIVPVLAPAKELLAHGDEEEPPVTGGGSVAGEQEGKDGEPNKGVGTPAAMMVKHGVSPIPSHTSTSSAASSPAAGRGQP